MKRSLAALALAAVVPLAACQSMGAGGGMKSASNLEGRWESADGVSVATFHEGSFTSRFTKNNEVLADGRYTNTGNVTQVNWYSKQGKQQKSASCTFQSKNSLKCNQPTGGSFVLNRV
ncbi:hypothetical protein SAMN05216548_104206 [Faunimonas pinastri]|uniref:Lipoprotein n=1 Tax=Faunimonas pinastri TaxID=1855383 RepID=A0A1H9FTG5_9HYPH|nr:hypothetical protein [Faunimonas pinastri]SEQ41165.1 hypothetical protein SAMN05216548_104206 [Faunimonas pinastri]